MMRRCQVKKMIRILRARNLSRLELCHLMNCIDSLVRYSILYVIAVVCLTCLCITLPCFARPDSYFSVEDDAAFLAQVEARLPEEKRFSRQETKDALNEKYARKSCSNVL